MRSFIVTLTIFLFPIAVGAQTAQNHGLGGGGTSFVGGYHANFSNPANVLLQTDRPFRLRFGIASASVNAGGPLMNVPVYNRYLTKGLTLTPDVSDRMLDEWFGKKSSASLGYSAEAVVFGMSYRNDDWAASFAIRNRVLGNASMSRGTAEAFFRLLDPEVFGAGEAVDWSVDHTAFTEISLGLAHELWASADGSARLNIGVAPKLLLAHNAESVEFESTLTVEDSGDGSVGYVLHEYSYRAQATGQNARNLDQFRRDHSANSDVRLFDYVHPALANWNTVENTGFGLDGGLSLQFKLPSKEAGPLAGSRCLNLGLSFTDFGEYDMRGSARQYIKSGSVLYQGFRFDRDAVDRDFGGDSQAYLESFLKDSVGLGKYLDFVSEDASSTKRALPGAIRLGGFYQSGRLGLAADLWKGSNQRGTNSPSPSMALGAEYRFGGFLPLRMGLRTGGSSSASFHFGTGVELANFEFSFSVSSTGRQAARGSSLGAAMSGLVFQF